MDFSQLIGGKEVEGSIRNWANDSKIPSVSILTDAQAWIFHMGKMRVRDMLTETTGSLAANADTITLPTNFLGNHHFMFTGVHKSKPRFKMLAFVREQFGYDSSGVRTTGKPQYYALDGAQLQFEVKAEQAYPYSYMHYAAPAALSGSNTTNFLTSKYPHILRYACLMFAAEHRKDDGERKYYLQLAEAAIGRANADSDMAYEGIEIDVEPE